MFKLIILVLLFSCKSSNIIIPLRADFERIHDKQYIVNVYDCSDKCIDYGEALERAGYKIQIHIFSTRNPKLDHSVVWVNNNYIDPTTGFSCKEPWEINSLFGGKLKKSITIAQLKKLK